MDSLEEVRSFMHASSEKNANPTISTSQPIMVLDKLCKRFGGVVAADEVSFSLSSARVHGLIGPNGSGKTTILNLISGITEMDAGNIMLDGEDMTNSPSYTRARRGIARTFQHPRLLKRCDIQSNLYLGIDLANKKGHVDNPQDASLEEILAAAGLRLDFDESITTLSYGPVSYTHLRAHETDSYLVCRLL